MGNCIAFRTPGSVSKKYSAVVIVGLVTDGFITNGYDCHNPQWSFESSTRINKVCNPILNPVVEIDERNLIESAGVTPVGNWIAFLTPGSLSKKYSAVVTVGFVLAGLIANGKDVHRPYVPLAYCGRTNSVCKPMLNPVVGMPVVK